MQVIGIVGLAGAGKSTVAKHLIERHAFQPGKFARCLKLMFRTFLMYRGATEGEIDLMLEGDLKEVPSAWLNGKTPRWAMQSLGVEWGRNCLGTDIWVQAEADHLNVDPGCPKNYRPKRLVFDDVRFDNEVALIRSLGGEIWEVSRTLAPAKAVEGAHASEKIVVVPDRRLVNAHTAAELHMHVDMALAGLVRRPARPA